MEDFVKFHATEYAYNRRLANLLRILTFTPDGTLFASLGQVVLCFYN